MGIIQYEKFQVLDYTFMRPILMTLPKNINIKAIRSNKSRKASRFRV